MLEKHFKVKNQKSNGLYSNSPLKSYSIIIYEHIALFNQSKVSMVNLGDKESRWTTTYFQN